MGLSLERGPGCAVSAAPTAAVGLVPLPPPPELRLLLRMRRGRLLCRCATQAWRWEIAEGGEGMVQWLAQRYGGRPTSYEPSLPLKLQPPQLLRLSLQSLLADVAHLKAHPSLYPRIRTQNIKTNSI